MKMKSLIVFSLSLFLLVSCHKNPRFVVPNNVTDIEKQDLSWAGKIGRKELFRTSGMSFHIIRLDEAEKPHIHENHDLFVIVLKGCGTFFIDDKGYEMKEGDSAFVQKGTKHYFVPRSKKVYAIVIFNPAFDGKDTIQVSN